MSSNGPASKQYAMQGLDQMFKIRITQLRNENEPGSKIVAVEAPLPDQFGMTVGSEFTAPFDASTLAGILQKFKIPSIAAGGIAGRVGVVTTKYYSNPEPTEISFDLEFHAEYSARDEVVLPVVELMKMSLGDSLTLEAAQQSINESITAIRGYIGSVFDREDGEDGDSSDNTTSNIALTDHVDSDAADGAMKLLGMIKGPPTTELYVGRYIHLRNVWVSSVTPQFSNVVDAYGFPLSATCSVTMMMQRDPVVPDINNMFNIQV